MSPTLGVQIVPRFLLGPLCAFTFLAVAASASASTAVAVAVGGSHTCVITSKGGVKCWGANDHGQLGDGTTTSRSAAADVAGLASGVTAIAAGSTFTCALTASGGVTCWGSGERGHLGNVTGLDQLSPAGVYGLTAAVVGIAAGAEHACAAVSGGSVKCWGVNDSGQLGSGDMTSTFVPVAVAGLAGATAIAAGGATTCALTNAGGVKCWGRNDTGQLGDGTTLTRTAPVDVVGLSSGVLQVSVGPSCACAMSANGVKCWGKGYLGDSGAYEFSMRQTPVDVVGVGTGAAAIAVGDNVICAIEGTGAVKCWGSFLPGSNRWTVSPTPLPMTALKSRTVAIAAGTHTCAVSVGGAVRCWGSNDGGALGFGGLFPFRSTPRQVLGLSRGVTSLGGSASSTCAVTSSGAVKCWGLNYNSQLGDGTTINRAFPAVAAGLQSGALRVSSEQLHTCAVASGGTVRCWGSNVSGQLGNGTTSYAGQSDVPGLAGVVDVSVGASHSCALTGTGGVKCWGDNSLGQLGDGTGLRRLAPVDVVGLTSGVVAIDSGPGYMCALTVGGAVRCWGYNGDGQLGDGTTTNRLAPVDVIGLSAGAKSIALGAHHSCAVTASGAAKCWGANFSGQLGAYQLTSASAPVDVVGLSSGVATVTAGFQHTCAAMTVGAIKCWGYNAHGELGRAGDGDATPSTVQGLGGAVTMASAGDGHTCAILAGGSVSCWGSNGVGQLGDGVLVLVGAIVAVPGFGVATDFNDDGKADIVNRDLAQNRVGFWLMNGPQIAQQPSTAFALDRNWVIAAIADFDQDGNADVAWQNVANGAAQISFMAGTTQSSSSPLTAPGAGWRIVAGADFNADGKTDILWRDRDTGSNAAWFMDGSTFMGDQPLEAWAEPNWTIVGAGDFNGDDRPDLLWRNRATGENLVWVMNGITRTGSVALETLRDVQWTVIAVGDFNTDGSPDIVWRNAATGETMMWLMAGTNHSSTLTMPTVSVVTAKRPPATGSVVGQAMWREDGQPLAPMPSSGGVTAREKAPRQAPTPDSGAIAGLAPVTQRIWLDVHDADENHASPRHGRVWEIAGIGDIDGDGHADIIWRNRATGVIVISFMLAGEQVATADLLPIAGEGWRVTAVADCDGDGQADLVWRNQATGEMEIWYLQPLRP